MAANTFPEIDPEQLGELTQWKPTVDIGEDSTEYLIVAEIPGVRRSELELTYHRNKLSIVCEASLHKFERAKSYAIAERALGMGRRIFALPDDADMANMTWSLNLGILRVRIPKARGSAVRCPSPAALEAGNVVRLPAAPTSGARTEATTTPPEAREVRSHPAGA